MVLRELEATAAFVSTKRAAACDKMQRRLSETRLGAVSAGLSNEKLTDLGGSCARRTTKCSYEVQRMLHRERERRAQPTDLLLAARVRAEVPDDTECVMEDSRARVAEHFDSRRLEGPYHTQAVLEQSRRDDGLEIWARPCGGKCSVKVSHPAETCVCPGRLAARQTLRAT